MSMRITAKEAREIAEAAGIEDELANAYDAIQQAAEFGSFCCSISEPSGAAMAQLARDGFRVDVIGAAELYGKVSW